MAIRKIIKRATDALFTNPEFDGTEAARIVKGTTGERANVEAGDLRFNTTTTLMEYYDGTLWKSIDSPPLISSISPTVESDANANIVITGTNFQKEPLPQMIYLYPYQASISKTYQPESACHHWYHHHCHSNPGCSPHLPLGKHREKSDSSCQSHNVHVDNCDKANPSELIWHCHAVD